ncbi:hypothetical protein B484DRAFT_49966, partial [Ochromonadaceae sp. CCMP2298]
MLTCVTPFIWAIILWGGSVRLRTSGISVGAVSVTAREEGLTHASIDLPGDVLLREIWPAFVARVLTMAMDPSLIRIIGNTGKEGKGEGQFSQPRGICIDAKTKEIFVVDCNNHRIQVYHLNSLAYIRQIGKGTQGSAAGSLNYAVGICMDDTNLIFVADTNNHRVVAFNRITGGHVRTIGSQGTAEGCLSSPYGVCLDMYTGILYVADYDNHRVQAYDKETGGFIKVIGAGFGSGAGQMNQPIVICIDYEIGHLLVADYSNNRVLVFCRDTAQFLRTFGGEMGDRLCGPRGLCLCKESKLLFVSDREHHRIQLFEKGTYTPLRSIGEGMGMAPGQFHRPMEVCVSVEEGVLLVVDGYNHRVQIIELPELQAQKLKLRAAARSKAEAELNGKNAPKPSLLAVATRLHPQDSICYEPRGARLRMRHFGSLFDVFVPQSDLPLLMAHLSSPGGISREALGLPGLQGLQGVGARVVQVKALGWGGVGAEVGVSEPQLQRQAEMYLAILSSLACEPSPSTPYTTSTLSPSTPASASSRQYKGELGAETAEASSLDSPDSDTPSYLFVAPPLFALHSLIERGWAGPISPQVIGLLVQFLSNIEQGIALDKERQRVLEAIMAVLRAAISISAELGDTVLEAILGCMWRPVLYAVDTRVGQGHDKGQGQVEGVKVEGVYILTAYFGILGSIVQETQGQGLGQRQGQGKRQVKSSRSKGLSRHSSHETFKQSCLLQRDVLDCMFGSGFMKAMHQAQVSRQNPISEATRTLKIPYTTEGNTGTGGAGDAGVGGGLGVVLDAAPGGASGAGGAQDASYVSVPRGFCQLLHITCRVRRLRSADQFTLLGCLGGDASESGVGGVGGALGAFGRQGQAQDEKEVQEAQAQALGDMQQRLFDSAAEYLSHLRRKDAGGAVGFGVLGSQYVRRTRGGRNIWRPEEALAAGDLVDAMDKEKCWFESIVQEITADGGVRVHFMGWGSKWDDVIPGPELVPRLAPLNSKTKNWRSDLFQGGLIEIKCNDDLVNQKWMWGRITALDTEEAWVEVSYSFSNEPTVVKRAWLFGETICPVGMHTKDKSKAAAALLVRPLKRVEDIIREKGDSLQASEAAFFGREDDYDEALDEGDRTLEYGAGVGVGAQGIEAGQGGPGVQGVQGEAGPVEDCFLPSVTELHALSRPAADPLTSVAVVGLGMLECVMGELVRVVSEAIGINAEGVCGEKAGLDTDVEVADARRKQLLSSAVSLLGLIAASPFKRLLVPYFSRILTFQAGLQAKIISSGFLAHQLTADLRPILTLLDRFKRLAAAYCGMAKLCLGGLSSSALGEVSSRICATVDRCGVTQIAHDLTRLMQGQRLSIFRQFMSTQRFGHESAKLRKVLAYVFRTSSRTEGAKFQALFEGTLMRAELKQLDFGPRVDSQGVPEAAWALGLVSGVVDVYETAQSLSRLELVHIPQCRMAADRALRREFRRLPSDKTASFALALAAALNLLLDPASAAQGVVLLPSRREALLASALSVQSIVMSEELLHHFAPAYQTLLAGRLLAGRYSAAVERGVLDALPPLPRALTMLSDLGNTSSYTSEFSRHLMGLVDDGLPYCPVMQLVLQRRQVSVRVLCQHSWHKSVLPALFGGLRLPPPMATLRSHFDCFHAQASHARSRRLTWCYGLGSVTLAYHPHNTHNTYRSPSSSSGELSLGVNEPQAAVMCLFNQGGSRSVGGMCSALGLCLEELRGVLHSLCCDSLSLPLLEVRPAEGGDGRSKGGTVHVVGAYGSGYGSDGYESEEATAGYVSGLGAGQIQMHWRVRLSRALLSGDFDVGTVWTGMGMGVGVVGTGTGEEEVVHFDYAAPFAGSLAPQDVHACRDWRHSRIDACIVRTLKAAARTGTETGTGTGTEVGTGTGTGAAHILATDQLVDSVIRILRRDHCAFTDTDEAEGGSSGFSGMYSSTEVAGRCEVLTTAGFIDQVQYSTHQALGAGGGSLRSVGYCYNASGLEQSADVGVDVSVGADAGVDMGVSVGGGTSRAVTQAEVVQAQRRAQSGPFTGSALYRQMREMLEGRQEEGQEQGLGGAQLTACLHSEAGVLGGLGGLGGQTVPDLTETPSPLGELESEEGSGEGEGKGEVGESKKGDMGMDKRPSSPHPSSLSPSPYPSSPLSPRATPSDSDGGESLVLGRELFAAAFVRWAASASAQPAAINGAHDGVL